MTDLKNINFSSEYGIVTRTEQNNILYTVNIPPSAVGYTLLGEGNFDSHGYFVIEYSTLGWKRPQKYRDFCITAEDENGVTTPLVCYDDLTADGKTYTVVAKLECKTFNRIKVYLPRGKRNCIEFTISKLYTCTEEELPVYCENLLTENVSSFTPLDISSQFNKRFSNENFDILLGGGRFFDKENISLSGIPFKVSSSGDNCIAPPPPASSEQVELPSPPA